MKFVRQIGGNKRNKRILSASLASVLLFLSVPSIAYAQVSKFVADMLASLAQVLIDLIGKLLVVLIEILLAIVKYNEFISAPAVQHGWVLVRDVSNMAFLIIFIAIAFATILGVEKYEWKRLLPKLLMMAVIINFSKTICGIMIDAAQVVMITFVNGFKDVAAGNLIRGFGLNDMLSLRDFPSTSGANAVNNTSVATASILAVVLLLIAAITMFVIVMMFLIRIIFLWILIVLSPLAFMLSAAPGGEGQFQKWFQQFIKYAFMGPILAFFLWLSFSVMATVAPGSNLATQSGISFSSGSTGFFEPANNVSASISGISQSDQLLSYFIAIALLIMSLITAQGMGVAGSKIAGDALAKIKSGGVKLGKLGALAVTGGSVAGGAALALGLGTQYGRRKLDDTAVKWGTKLPFMGVKAALDKTIGRTEAGKKFLGKTRLYKGVSSIAKKGIKARVVAKAWKDAKEQKEKERTAEYYGTARDALTGFMHNEQTNYGMREYFKILNEKRKAQDEEGDGSNSYLKAMMESGNKFEKLAAYAGLQEKTSVGGVMSEDKDLHQRVVKNNENELEKMIQERDKLLNGRKAEDLSGKEEENLKDLDRDIKEQKEHLESLKVDSRTGKKIASMDSDEHRMEYFKREFGDNEETWAAFAKINNIARKNGEWQMYGAVEYSKPLNRHVVSNLSSSRGRREKTNRIAGRASFADPSETLKADGASYRNQLVFEKDKDGKVETGLSEFTDTGRVLLGNLAGNITDRNYNSSPVANFTTMVGGDIISQRKGTLTAETNEEKTAAREKLIKDTRQGVAEMREQGILSGEDMRLFGMRLNKMLENMELQVSSANIDLIKENFGSEDKFSEGVDLFSKELGRQLDHIAELLKNLSGEEKANVANFSSTFSGLRNDLASASNIADKNQKESKIKDLFSEMIRNQAKFASVLSELNSSKKKKKKSSQSSQEDEEEQEEENEDYSI